MLWNNLVILFINIVGVFIFVMALCWYRKKQRLKEKKK